MGKTAKAPASVCRKRLLSNGKDKLRTVPGTSPSGDCRRDVFFKERCLATFSVTKPPSRKFGHVTHALGCSVLSQKTWPRKLGSRIRDQNQWT